MSDKSKSDFLGPINLNLKFFVSDKSEFVFLGPIPCAENSDHCHRSVEK